MAPPSPALDVAIDLDGCVYPFGRVLREYVHERWGVPLARLPEPTEWDFFRRWGLSAEAFWALCAEATRAGVLFRRGDPEPGALDALRSLHRAGHRLHVVTARGIAGVEAEALAATRWWLRRWDFPPHTLTLTDDKAALAHIDVAVDDSVAHHEAYEAVGTPCWLFDQPWNAEHGGRRVRTWADFAHAVGGHAALAA